MATTVTRVLLFLHLCIHQESKEQLYSPELTEFQTALEQKQGKTKQTASLCTDLQQKKYLCQMQVTRTKQEPQRTKSILSTTLMPCAKKQNKKTPKQSAQCPEKLLLAHWLSFSPRIVVVS